MSKEGKGRKITSVAIVLLIVGIVVGGIVGYGSTAGQISSLQTQIASLQATNTQLQGQVLSLQVNQTQLESQISSLQTDKTGLQSMMTSLESDKAGLQAQITSLQSQLTSLSGSLTQIISLQAQITSLQNDKIALENKITQLEASNIELLGVFFSPKGGCEAQIVDWINRANTSVHVLIYSFTLESIGNALIGDYQKSIDVKVVFEKSQVSQYSEMFTLEAAGVPVRNDTNSALMHEKVAIIDGKIVIVGSYNWSGEAEDRNNENLLIIYGPSLAALFENDFQRIWQTGK